MKGSLAAMLIAAERFVSKNPDFSGSLGFLITSGEEGDDYQAGTPHVMRQLQRQELLPDFCIVGEPSSTHKVGDMIKVGRRGSLSAKITLQGKQGHVAYPHLAQNPIHDLAPVLLELTSRQWDAGNQHFPPTTLQITQIQAGGHANNIIPGELTLRFNIRYSTEQTAMGLTKAVEDCFRQYQLNPVIEWQFSGDPFLTAQGRLLESSIRAIQLHTGITPELSTSGGTSDGRFIAPFGVEVIELGPVNATIHQVNECVAEADLEQLSDIYCSICEDLLI
jgi:succinyl-diaminopimelate desuccinylase